MMLYLAGIRCPANPNHILVDEDRFKKHIISCQEIKDKKIYRCMNYWFHQFLSSEDRDNHEITCISLLILSHI